jgi:hypothetical protein
VSGEPIAERLLREADVLGRFTLVVQGGGGHADKYGVVLAGNSHALVKPGSTAINLEMAKNEVAAWQLAIALGWPDLLPCSVMRTLTTPGGATPVECAVMTMWPGTGDAVPDIARFSTADVWRAGIFDYLVEQSDRRNNNYLGLASDGEYRLLLIDHGYSFGTQGRPAGSQFTDKVKDTVIPARCRDDLSAVNSACG